MDDQKPRATEKNYNDITLLLAWFMSFEEREKDFKMDGSIEKSIKWKKLLDERR